MPHQLRVPRKVPTPIAHHKGWSLQGVIAVDRTHVRRELRVSLMCLDYSSTCYPRVFTTRHWWTPGRRVQELNVCTAIHRYHIALYNPIPFPEWQCPVWVSTSPPRGVRWPQSHLIPLTSSLHAYQVKHHYTTLIVLTSSPPTYQVVEM